jgi:hypothetical protein
VREKIRELAERSLRRRLWDGEGEAALDAAAQAALEERRNPYELAVELANRLDGRPGGVS